jgi:hypothetical protein
MSGVRRMDGRYLHAKARVAEDLPMGTVASFRRSGRALGIPSSGIRTTRHRLHGRQTTGHAANSRDGKPALEFADRRRMPHQAEPAIRTRSADRARLRNGIARRLRAPAVGRAGRAGGSFRRCAADMVARRRRPVAAARARLGDGAVQRDHAPGWHGDLDAGDGGRDRIAAVRTQGPCRHARGAVGGRRHVHQHDDQAGRGPSTSRPGSTPGRGDQPEFSVRPRDAVRGGLPDARSDAGAV